MSESEINNLYDARQNGLISNLSAECEDYETFEKRYKATAAYYGRIGRPLDPVSNLRDVYTASRTEHDITSMAIDMVQAHTCSKEISKEQAATFKENDAEINGMGMQIANGPDLTILDGGPGAGKSFSLGKAVDVMQVDVICLGATKSAGAGLYDDMQDAQKEHDKSAQKNGLERGKDLPGKVNIFGGLSIDDLLPEDKQLDTTNQKDKDGNEIPNSSPAARKEALLARLADKSKGKPCIMVDEAGLLDHKQMKDIIAFGQKYGVKMILAGDSKQIPPEKGQPFKTLVESLKETPAYVNAPYVFRQSNFADKAITSGIYNELSSDEVAISRPHAVEFLEAAYAVKGGPAKPPKNGDITFQDYLNDPKFKDMDGNTPVERYVDYLDKNKDKLIGTDKDKISAIIKAGPGKNGENYDAYMCACMVSQNMGIQAYEMRGQTTTHEDIYADVAQSFADEYKQSLDDGLKARIDKAKEKAEKAAKDEKKSPEEIEKAGKDAAQKAEKEQKLAYSDGKLAITATKEEAKELNDAIREAIIQKNGGKLPEVEPVIVNGSRKLATQEEIQTMNKDGIKFDYAYALDVTTTQGMSQNGKVTFVVRGDTMNKMHGGEILVGATRHKGKFEIKMDPKAAENKDKFYDASKQQFASARVINSAFNKELHEAAGGKVATERESEVKKEKKSVMSSLRQIGRELKRTEEKTFSGIKKIYNKQQQQQKQFLESARRKDVDRK